MSFHTELIVESLGNKWKLRAPFDFYYENDFIKIEVAVPENFITDFASTPRILWTIFPPIGIYNKAVLLHDYLYDISCPLKITRLQADLFMLQAMEVLEVKPIVRWLMFLGVRLGGASSFRKPGESSLLPDQSKAEDDNVQSADCKQDTLN